MESQAPKVELKEIGLDVGTPGSRFSYTGNDTFSANFDTSNNTAYKLKILINVTICCAPVCMMVTMKI